MTERSAYISGLKKRIVRHLRDGNIREVYQEIRELITILHDFGDHSDAEQVEKAFQDFITEQGQKVLNGMEMDEPDIIDEEK